MSYSHSPTVAPSRGQPIVSSLASLLSPEQLQQALVERSRIAALAFGVELLEQEVEALCGPRFSRKGEAGHCHRGGSEPSSILLDGGRVPIRRPRVRGQLGEVELPLYTKMRDQDLLDSEIQDRMLRGVSTRNYGPVVSAYAKKLGVSKSSSSRAFIRASRKALDEINHGDLAGYSFVALMVDGVEYAGRTVVVALGITDTLGKVPLGVTEGDTENADLVKDLLSRIVDRGFRLHCERLLAVIDGAKALKKALLEVFRDRVVIQRCWLHKLRNLKAHTPRQYHAQLYWRMKKLMGLVRYDEAIRELESLAHWLSGISQEAEASVHEVGREILAVHSLQLPRLLRQALSSTNAIESLIGVVREKTGRVKNWKSRKTSQILRWVATSLKHHSPQMRRLRGYKEVKALINALGGEKKLATHAKAA